MTPTEGPILTMDNTLPLGVIFDIDGVLVDSEELMSKAACRMFSELGLTVRLEDSVPFIGMGETRFIAGVAEKYHFPVDLEAAQKRLYDIYLEMIKGTLRPLPGVHTFIQICRDRGKRIAVASSADRRKVLGNLKEIELGPERFDAVITAEDVVHKKPAPDIFLLAAKRLGFNPQDCLVVEDAVSGVTAAKAAGARCLAITSSFSREQLKGADYWAADLANASLDVLNW